MAKDSGSGGNIYGKVPVPDSADSAISDAMSSLNESSSNKVNGPTKSKEVDYPEED